MPPYRVELTEDGPKGGWTSEAHLQMRTERVGLHGFEKLVWVEQTRQRAQTRARSAEEPLKEELHALERRKGGNRRATVRRDQGEALAAVGRAERELLSDHAPHRNADHVRSVPREVIQDPNGIVGHAWHGPEERSAIAVTDPQMIVEAAAVVMLKSVDLRPPDRPGHPKPHDEEDGRPLAAEGLVAETRRSPGKPRIQPNTLTDAVAGTGTGPDTDTDTDPDTVTAADPATALQPTPAFVSARVKGYAPDHELELF